MPDPGKTPEHGTTLSTRNAWSSHGSQEPAFEVFHSPEGVAFADIFVRGHRETHPIKSKEFWRGLALYLLEYTGEAPSAELKRRIELLDAKALQPESPVREVYLRVASLVDRIYIDLADASWSAIEIGADGWRVVQCPPVRFVRMRGMLPLPVRESGGSLETLRNLLNLHDEDFILVVAWLLDALGNSRQHVVLVLSGGEGTAKSTVVELLRALIDPSSAPLGGLPRTERELQGLASQRYLQAFDNASALTIPMSDAFCRLSTGSGSRPIILNGIEDVVTRPDLADRCLFINCDSIPDERRRSAGELWAAFEKVRAEIIGLLLDGLSHGLRILPETRPEQLPRMADFARWVTACEGALWPKGTFSAVYAAHHAEVVERLIGADPVASAIRRLAAKQRIWSGTASELDNFLRALTGNLDFTKAWPLDSARLATRLRQLAPSLNKLGIEMSFNRSGHDRTRLITISAKTKAPDPRKGRMSPSAASATSSGPFKTAADDRAVVRATATDTSRASTATQSLDDGKPSSKADGADGADAELDTR
jgi:hypothetical protein